MARYAIALLLTLEMVIGMGPVAVGARDATPGTPTTARTLFETIVDRDQLPGEEGLLILGRHTFVPGSRRTFDSPGVVGSEAIVVASGELTVEIPGADGRILRGAGADSPREEAAPAGTPFTLAAGDAFVYPLQKHIESNAGQAPAAVFFAVSLEPTAPPEPDPSDIGEVTTEFLAQTSGEWPPLPPGPVTLGLRSATIGAGELLPTPAGGIQTVAQLSGAPDVLVVAGNGALNLGEAPVDVLVFDLAPTSGTAASPVAAATAAAAMAGRPPSAAPPEVLLTTTIPAARLPKGPAAVEFWTWSWEPGEHYLASEYHPTVSVGGDLVLSGTYGSRSDGDILAWRDGRIEEVPLNQEVVLNTGEAVIYLDNAANEWFRNAGDTTTALASFAITLGDDYQGPNLGVDWEKSGLSGHDVTVTIDRQTLAPGEALPPISLDPTAPTVRIVEEGELTWEFTRPGDQEAAPAVRFPKGATVPFVAPATGGQIELSNAGNTPLVLLTLTLTSAGAAGSTPSS